jgi:hypothetical protein
MSDNSGQVDFTGCRTARMGDVRGAGPKKIASV